MLGATKPATGRFTVVLDPLVTAMFLEIIGRTLSGESVVKGRSLFAERVGEQVASPLVSFVDDPTDGRQMSAAVYDQEGVVTRRNAFIDQGVLTGFAHNASTGRALGAASNGCASRMDFKSRPSVGCVAARLEPGDRSPEELLAGVTDGILVQEVSGLHSGVNPISGDFSTGAAGLRIRNGAVAEPLREFTIASTLQRMLLDLQAVGNDLVFLPLAAAGTTLVIDDITVSGA